MRERGFAGICLHNPKTPANVGATVRAAGCFGADFVQVVAARFPWKRSEWTCTDPSKSRRHVPVFFQGEIAVPRDSTPVLVELHAGATSLEVFQHPEAAFYVFGGEDETLPHDLLPGAPKVIIPMPGHGRCLNLAQAVNVVLYDRVAKELLTDPRKLAKELLTDPRELAKEST